jgi:hypothetical protein
MSLRGCLQTATLIKKALQDVIVPELHAIRGDIRVLDQKVIGLDEKIDSMKSELVAELAALEARR